MQGCFMQFLGLIFVRKLQGALPLTPIRGVAPWTPTGGLLQPPGPHFSADFSILNSRTCCSSCLALKRICCHCHYQHVFLVSPGSLYRHLVKYGFSSGASIQSQTLSWILYEQNPSTMKCSRGQLRNNGACCARENARARFQLRTAFRASASRAEDPGFESRWRRDFSGSSHTSDINIGTPVATLPDAWYYRVSAGTGQTGVSILWQGEVESWICSFYFSVAASKIVWADPSLRYTRLLLGRWATNQPTNLQLLPQCGSTENSVSRSFPEIH